MADTDLGLKLFGKTLCDLACDPVLAKWSIYENPYSYYQEQNGEKEPQQYFLECLQGQ